MPSLPKDISDFMETHGVDAEEVWAVRPGAYAIKHRALERVAAANKIDLSEKPSVLQLDMENKIAVLLVWGKMGERVEWSVGEATAANCKNSYLASMAEKRGKDRVILKLLNAHGAIYSESEADEFTDPGQGEKGRLLPSSQYARNEASKLMMSMRNCNSLDMLEAWGKAHREEIRAQPEKHAEAIRQAYSELADELRNSAA